MEDYGNVIQWLLEENAPHVKYNTLRHILRCPLDDAKVIESRERMMESPPVSNILAKQNPDGGFLQKSFVKSTGWLRSQTQGHHVAGGVPRPGRHPGG